MERYERVRLTNPDKVLYPATGTTKAEVFEYYVAIADVMVPHIAGPPRHAKALAQRRRREPTSSRSSWRRRPRTGCTAVPLGHKSGTTTYPVIDTREGLAWIAQQAALEVHVPQWRFVDGEPGAATRIVFDLDPGEGVTMPHLCEVASAVRELMTDIGLDTYPVTSGSKGIHLYAPLADPISLAGASVLAKRIAQQLEKCDARSW